MRIIKRNTLTYESFHKSLPYFTKTGKRLDPANSGFTRNPEENPKDYNASIFINLLNLEKYVKSSKNFQQSIGHFNTFLKNILALKEANIFLFDEAKSSLISLSQLASERIKYFVNKAYTDGKFEDLFSTGKHKILFDPLVHDIDGSKSFYLVMPITENNKNKGVLAVLFSGRAFAEDAPEINYIRLGLSFLLNKIESILQQKELKNVYDDLQIYQSKLANDYKLSAIGELTSGIVEDILSPLQVITSTTELLRGDDAEADGELLDRINVQVKKVKNIINRLVNFAGITDGRLKIQSCNFNQIITEFYQVIITSLQNDNYECVLDLEDNLPSVLSHPNYINQLLSNIFSLLKSKDNVGGGILIQTKYVKEKISLKFLSTGFLENMAADKLDRMNDANIRIIKNIITKHEGQFRFETDKKNGTMLHLLFPLKRNI